MRHRPFRRDPLLCSQQISHFGQAEQPSPSGRWGLAGCPGLSCSLGYRLQGFPLQGQSMHSTWVHSQQPAALPAQSSRRDSAEGNRGRWECCAGTHFKGGMTSSVLRSWHPLICEGKAGRLSCNVACRIGASLPCWALFFFNMCLPGWKLPLCEWSLLLSVLLSQVRNLPWA